MSNLVQTTQGLIELDELEIKDIITVEDNARSIASEYFHNDELVRRDVAVSILRAPEIQPEQQAL